LIIRFLNLIITYSIYSFQIYPLLNVTHSLIKTIEIVEFCNTFRFFGLINFIHKINQIVTHEIEEVCDEVQLNLKELFQNNPFQIKAKIDELLNNLIQ